MPHLEATIFERSWTISVVYGWSDDVSVANLLNYSAGSRIIWVAKETKTKGEGEESRVKGMDRSRKKWEQLAIESRYDSTRMANLCKISARQLQRLFRQEFAQSPQRWLNERRIVVAEDLLLRGIPVKTVAFELGFKQPSHFCRQFRVYKFLRPSQFIAHANRHINVARG